MPEGQLGTYWPEPPVREVATGGGKHSSAPLGWALSTVLLNGCSVCEGSACGLEGRQRREVKRGRGSGGGRAHAAGGRAGSWAGGVERTHIL